jgi:hypothetical protein
MRMFENLVHNDNHASLLHCTIECSGNNKNYNSTRNTDFTRISNRPYQNFGLRISMAKKNEVKLDSGKKSQNWHQDTRHNDTWHNDTQHNDNDIFIASQFITFLLRDIMVNVIMPSVIMLSCHYADVIMLSCRYAE